MKQLEELRTLRKELHEWRMRNAARINVSYASLREWRASLGLPEERPEDLSDLQERYDWAVRKGVK